MKGARIAFRVLLALIEGALAFGLVVAAILVLPRQMVVVWFVIGAVALGWAWFMIVRSLGLVPLKSPRPSWECLVCGYDRRGLAADAACPECGGRA